MTGIETQMLRQFAHEIPRFDRTRFEALDQAAPGHSSGNFGRRNPAKATQTGSRTFEIERNDDPAKIEDHSFYTHSG